MSTKGCVGLVVVLAVLGLAAPAGASVIAYQVPAGQAGNQAFGGELGMEFNVNWPITITKLGVFDDGSDGLNRNLTARLWDRTSTGTPLATLSFTPGDPGTLVGGSRFKTLGSPLALPVGFQGTISASGYGGGERNGNSGGSPPPWTTDSAGGILSFVGSSRWGNTPGVYPPNADTGPANRYAAGTFVYDFALNDPILDTATQGDWIGVYGTQGYVLPAFGAGNSDVESLPGYVDSVSIGGARYTWATGQSAVRALLDPADPGNTSARKATCTYSGGTFDVTVNLDKPQTFLMSFYLLDWDSTSRRQSIDVFGYNPVDDGDFHDGHWYQYLVSGGPGKPVTVRFNKLAGANTVLSAVTFDPVPEPSTLLIWSLLAGLGIALGWRRRR